MSLRHHHAVIAALAGSGGSTPPAGPLPAFVNSQVRHSSGEPSVVVQFPATVTAGNFLFLGLMHKSALEPVIVSVPTGFVAITGWTVVTSTGQGDTNPLHLRGYWKKAVGDEGGTESAVVTNGNASRSTICAQFSGVSPDVSPPIEQFGSGVGRGAPLTMPTLTTSVDRRLGLAFACFGNNETINAFAGGSGQSWVVAREATTGVGNQRALALLTCDLSTAATSSGHQDTALRANNDWAIAKLALLPNPTGA